MKIGSEWVTFPSVGSTQTVASRFLAGDSCPDVVFAIDQTGGRGRLGREWHSEPGDSLTMSLIMKEYADHPKPWLVGMAVGLAATRLLECQIRWPNDLVVKGKKIGGILTELFEDREGRRVPVVGVGFNVNQSEFPESIASFATSVFLEYGQSAFPVEVARALVHAVSDMPEPDAWSDLAPIWYSCDDTPGKVYRTAGGEEAVAVRVGPEGELIAVVQGVEVKILAAEAVFGA